jgi:hypothetical protein
MSPVWMQYDAARAQSLFAPQRPEQHWVLDVHVLFAEVHPPPPRAWQVPLEQFPVQQTFPVTPAHD